MNINFDVDNVSLGICLYDSLFARIFRLSNKENAREFVNLFKRIFTDLQLMYEIDPTKLSDEEFCQFVFKNYTFDLSIDDYIKIYNISNNRKYNYYTNFKTNMVDEVAKMNGPELYDGWCLQLAEILYKVLLSTDINYDYTKRYSTKEIENMINNKELILLEKEFSYLSESDINYESEEKKDFKIHSFGSCKRKDSPYFNTYVDVLRKIFTNERIFEDFKRVILIIQKELDGLLKDMNFVYEQQEIIFYVNEMLNSSDEYKSYQKLLKSLNK